MLSPLSDVTLDESSALAVNNPATDDDLPANSIVYQILAGPTNASIDTNGFITWTPTQAQRPSTNVLTIVATDDGIPALSATNSFTVTALGTLQTNHPPVLASIADRTVHAGAVVTITNEATDPDLPSDSLLFSLTPGAPTGAGIHPVTGIFTWPTTDGDADTINPVTVRVTDSGVPALEDSKTFTVTVISRLMIESVDVADDEVTVTWNAIIGQTYRLQYKADLQTQDWEDVTGDIVADEPLVSQSHSIPIGTQKAFYRVIAVPE
jgi:hypothetical protein